MKYILIILFPSIVFTQEPLDNLIERYYGQGAAQEIEQIIQFYSENPINVSGNETSELNKLPGFDREEINQLILLLKDNNYKNVMELSNDIQLNGFQLYVLDNCLSFKQQKELKLNIRSRLNPGLNQKLGFINNDFHQNNYDLFNRIHLNYGNSGLSILSKRNAGERVLFEHLKGALYYSGKNFNLIFGDFSVDLGMGALIATDFPLRKSPGISKTMISLGNGFRPDLASSSWSNFRGIGLECQTRINSLILMNRISFSYTPRSGLVDSINAIQSISTGNYFRTNGEFSRRNTFYERGIILNSSLRSKSQEIGMNFYNFQTNEKNEIVNYSYFNKRNTNSASLYYNYFNKRTDVIGEIAFNEMKKISFLSGVRNKIGKNIISAFIRILEDSSRSPFSNFISDASNKNNEVGLFLSFKYVFDNKVSGILYLDNYRSINSISNNFQKKGYSLFNEIYFKIKKGRNVIYRFDIDKENNYELNEKYNLFAKSRINNRIELIEKLNKRLDARVRFDHVIVKYKGINRLESGSLFFVDIKYKLSEKFKANSRYTIFSTTGFDSAIWHFEYIAPGLITAPPLYGSGNRIIINLKYELSEKLKFSARYMNNFKNGIQYFGTGLDRVDGNIDRRLNFQLDYNL